MVLMGMQIFAGKKHDLCKKLKNYSKNNIQTQHDII